MKIKAKFRCQSVTDIKYSGLEVRQLAFEAVYASGGENNDFATATPYGELKMNVDKSTAAYEAFTPGKDYYLDFNEVPEAPEVVVTNGAVTSN